MMVEGKPTLFALALLLVLTAIFGALFVPRVGRMRPYAKIASQASSVVHLFTYVEFLRTGYYCRMKTGRS